MKIKVVDVETQQSEAGQQLATIDEAEEDYNSSKTLSSSSKEEDVPEEEEQHVSSGGATDTLKGVVPTGHHLHFHSRHVHESLSPVPTSRFLHSSPGPTFHPTLFQNTQNHN